MRAGPLGALYADRPALLAHAVMPSSLITHSDIRPASLAYTVAWANLTRVNGKSPRQIRKECPVAVARVAREWLAGHRDWDSDRSGGHHQKRREAPAFRPGMDRRWARRAQCPRAQQDPRSTRALNGRGNCRGGSPGIHAGEDVHVSAALKRLCAHAYDSLDDMGKAVRTHAAHRSGQPRAPGFAIVGSPRWCDNQLLRKALAERHQQLEGTIEPNLPPQ
jgi:hypothetical protein